MSKDKRGYDKDKLNAMYKKGYYDYLCSESYKVLYDFAASFIKDDNIKSVLDIGCWNGMFYRSIKELNTATEYSGYDLCSEAIKDANKNYKNSNTNFYVHNWNEQFTRVADTDFIYFGGVLYYIYDKVAFLKRFIKQHNPKIIAIQDLQNTDLSKVMSSFQVLDHKTFFIDYDINEARKMRQVLILRVR